MSYIWICGPRHASVPAGPAIDVRCDLPFGDALATALAAFEAAYVRALVEQQASLANAARAAGIPVHELVDMLLRGKPASDAPHAL